VIPNPWVILGGVGAWLASLVLCGWLMYARGHDDMRNAQTEANFAQAQKDLNDHKKNDAIADKAGKGFEDAKPKIITQVQYRDRNTNIPSDADPFVPVWFVRMFNDIASVEPPADAYPGQPDSAPSRTRLSGTRAVLKAWAIKYETCRAQIDGIRELKPVLPTPAEDQKSVFDHINPFN
jgi:hypothetical protein